MDTNEQIDPEYQKGFNYGYMIAEHIPNLAQQLSTATGDGAKFVGLREGIEQYTKELDKKLTPQILKKDEISPNEVDKTEIEKEID